MHAFAKILAVAILSVTFTAHAQPALDSAEPSASAADRGSGLEAVARREAAIREEASLNGPHSPALADHYMALGLRHQENGDHALAVESLEQALQVKRVNDGLYTLEQVPMLRQLRTSEDARGNESAAQELDDRILRLTRFHPNDLRIVPILHEMGDRQLALSKRYLDGELSSPTISIGIGLFGGSARRNNDTGPGAASSLRQASRNYSSAIGVLLRNGLHMHEDLPELESKLLNTYYLQATGLEARPGGQSLFRLGERSIIRQIEYRAESATATELAKGLIELADWQLLFSRNGQALDQYQQAYALLAEHGASKATLDELFSPAIPVVLPAFVPNPLATENPDASAGHIDVRFELGRFGTSRRIEIVDATPDATEDLREHVTRVINRSRFRPRLTDAESVDTSPLVMRYQLPR